MPNYLKGDAYSFENLLSRIFEDAVSNYLIEKYQYQAKPRVRLKYLESGEVDVFAEKGITPRVITICECKLRFNETPISLEEVIDFNRKVSIIKQEEVKRGETRFYFWFVSNIDIFEDRVLEYCKTVGIEIMIAKLDVNWRKKSTWFIQSLIKK
jgi:hypothetical protein